MTRNGGASWAGPYTRANGLSSNILTDVAVDPSNPAVAYASFAGYDEFASSPDHVFKTTDFGATWTTISTALPDIPVNSIAIDQAHPGIVYLGTDLGVYKSMDAGQNWQTLDVGLPNVVVLQVVLNRAGTILFAVTHGRSVFMATRSVVVDCTSRPSIQVSAAPAGPGRLQVTRTTQAADVPLAALVFGSAVNGVIDVNGVVGSPGNIQVSIPPGTQFTFSIRRLSAGAATTVPFTILDACGPGKPWPTFAGGGPTAF